jgi:RimJ/RimL family protein N-acetyltransferase
VYAPASGAPPDRAATPAAGRRFHGGYAEPVVLADGTPVLVRLLRPEDAPLLVEAFGRLSDESRHMRFHGAKSSLSPAEVKYLTELDGDNHFALGAVVEDGGRGEGVGVARFIRQAGDPRTAEVAIVVADRLQGKGLGRVLLERLIAAARERGVGRFRFNVLSTNQGMRDLLHGVVPAAVEEDDGSLVRFSVALDAGQPEAPPDYVGRHPVLHHILGILARYCRPGADEAPVGN